MDWRKQELIGKRSYEATSIVHFLISIRDSKKGEKWMDLTNVL